MSKPTIKHIIVDWLDRNRGMDVPTHRIEMEIPRFAELLYGQPCTPGTVARKFRELKQEPDMLARHGLQLIDVSDKYPNKDEKVWNVCTQS